MRRGSFSLSLLLTIICAVSTYGCPKPSDAKKDESSTPKPPPPVPSDFALNDFLGNPADQNGKANGPGTDPNGAMPAGSASGAASGAPVKAPVSLLGAGAEPRAVRKYALALGTTETISVTLRSSVSEERPGQKPAQEDTAPMVFTLAVTPKGKTPEGDFVLEMKLVKADVVAGPGASADPRSAQIGEALRGLAGLAGSFRIDEHGHVRDVSIAQPTDKRMAEAASQFVPLLAQSLEQIVAVLPSEAIGKGAKWEVDAMNHDNGISSMSRSISTLKDVGDDGLQISVTTTRTAPKQNVGDPREAASLTIDGTETTNLKVKLDRMVMKAQGDSTLALTVDRGGANGAKQSSRQKISLHQVIENAKP